MIALVIVYVPESPKYLYAKGNHEQFLKAMIQINKFNKGNNSQCDPEQLLIEHDMSLQSSMKLQIEHRISSSQRSKDNGSMKQLISNKVYRVNTVALIISWGVSSYSFYFIEFYMKYVPVESIYWLSIMIGMSDVASSSTFNILLKYFKIRSLFAFFFLMLGVLSLIFSMCIWFI